jgi:signal transduction histidine kinase
MRILRPRTIRGQLMGGLILFEILVLAILSILVLHEQRQELQSRTDQRLEYQASTIALQSGTALEDKQLSSIEHIVSAMRAAPGIRSVQITDMRGRTLVSNGPEAKGGISLSPYERTFLRELSKPAIFWSAPHAREAVAPIRIHGELQALVWIYPDDSRDRKQLQNLMRITLFSAVLAIAACTLFASFMARAIARPLGVLMQATRKLVHDPEDTSSFPIPVSSANEAADLTLAFNLMVASMAEQRAGLNDTLALLDSMLANAPIGFAFFDHRLRMVRVNQFLARMNDLPVSRHLGKAIEDVFAPAAASRLSAGIKQVFQEGYAVRDLELINEEPGQMPTAGVSDARSWLANIYPVRTDTQTVRWVGVILVETTERRRAEEALRKSEKLAATGRLAASIAHEINNPLEAVTNLLYLIRHGELDRNSMQYAELAQDEIARMSEITQQMLRFYRQSTKPVLANVCALLDSVMALHQRRAAALQIEIVRSYKSDVELFCFSGEMRQLLNNLIANAIDAMTPGGGRLSMRVQQVRRHPLSGTPGVRVTIADTGCGMSREVRRHIFEPFFTTKEDTGTGLGLWVSAEIIQKHKGSVSIRSLARDENGKGGWTVFSLFFPSDLEQTLQSEAVELQASDPV